MRAIAMIVALASLAVPLAKLRSVPDNRQGQSVPSVLKYLHFAFAAVPLAALAAVNLLSWRAAVKLGHWPVPWQDDPKCLVPDDVLMQVLYPSVLLLLLGAAATILIFPVLMEAVGYAYSASSRWMLVLIFAGGWVLLALDPGARFTWFLD